MSNKNSLFLIIKLSVNFYNNPRSHRNYFEHSFTIKLYNFTIVYSKYLESDLIVNECGLIRYTEVDISFLV